MQIHKPSYCCEQMQTWITNNVIAVNYTTGAAHMNVVHTLTPDGNTDQDPQISVIPIEFCPNCGTEVKTYDEPVPAPTYTRAATNGATCDDVTCRYNNTTTHKCAYAFRNESGCFSTNEATKQAVEDLRAKLNFGENEMLSQ